jgi:hypothetical protein
MLGTGVWHAFVDSTHFTQTIVLEQGGTGWEKIQSAFSAARNWGVDVPAAYAIQLAFAIALAVTLAWLWHGDAAFELKAAALTTASLLATPYVLDYDLVVLAIAIAFLARRAFAFGLQDYEISLLAVAWLMPLVTRSIAGISGIPLALIVLLILYCFILKFAWRERENASQARARVAQA